MLKFVDQPCADVVKSRWPSPTNHPMFQKPTKISLIYFVLFTLLLVGLVPLVLTGWFLSERSARELRAVENRYQLQLVQAKARQMEMFGQRYGDLVKNLAAAFELSNNLETLSSTQTEDKLGTILKENPSVLALYLKPANEQSFSIFRPGIIAKDEIESISLDALTESGTQEFFIGSPKKASSSGESVMTMVSQVSVGDRAVASVVAIVSLKEIARSIVGTNSTSEDELWKAGLPIIFVIDENGNAIFHPDPSLVEEHRSLTNLKIVDDWQQSNRQIQSGLVPFTAEFGGNMYDMIGAYSTVNLGSGAIFGVITMQDERKALASVGEMRTQTWMISLAFAFFALLIGLIAAKSLTSPLLKLSAAAEKIAMGDLST